MLRSLCHATRAGVVDPRAASGGPHPNAACQLALGRRVGNLQLRRIGVVQDTERPYSGVVRALLEDGPRQGESVEVEPVEGRPPKTIDLSDGEGGTSRYCLSEWTQEGMTADYTFLYAV